MKVRFADFVLDSESRQLLSDGKPLHLSPKAFSLLLTLVDGRPRAFSKDQLLKLVWPGVFVSEANLASVVAEIRRALGDNSRAPKYVRTAYGFGYAFSGTATDLGDKQRPPAGETNCWLVGSTRRFELTDGENLIGRDPGAAVWLDASSVSRRHACITLTDGRAVLEDCESKNGTFLCGRKVRAPEPLNDGDEVRIGKVELTFVVRSIQLTMSTETGGAGEAGRRAKAARRSKD